MVDLEQLNPEFFRPYLIILKYFRLTGIDIFGENHYFFKFKYTYCLVFLFYLIQSISHWRYLIEKVYGGADLLELAVDLSYNYNSIEGCFIYLHICTIKTRIKNFVMKLEKLWCNDDTLPTNIVLLKRYQVRKLDLYNLVYCTLLTVFIHCYMATPLLILLFKKFILNYDEPYITPFKFTLPFDYQQNIVIFIIIYMLDYLIACSLAYLINCSLFLLTVSMNQLGTLFVLLQEDFREIIESSDKNIDVQLKRTIQRHLVLSELSIELSGAYGAIFAIHIFFLSATICFYGIAARINSRLEDFKNLLISVLTIVNIFHCCRHGQLAADSAQNISTAIYDSPWENLSCKNKRIILLTILRSQRATYIRSTSFTEISLKTFIMILNMSWSFISLVTKLYEN